MDEVFCDRLHRNEHAALATVSIYCSSASHASETELRVDGEPRTSVERGSSFRFDALTSVRVLVPIGIGLTLRTRHFPTQPIAHTPESHAL